MFVTITKIIRGQDALSSPYIPPISFQRATAEASFKDSVLREDMWTLNPNKVPSFFISAWAWKYEFMIDRSKDELLKTVRWGEITNFTCIPVIFKRNLCKFTASASSLLICSGHLADSLHVCELAASFVEEIQLIHFEYMYASLFLSRFTWSNSTCWDSTDGCLRCEAGLGDFIGVKLDVFDIGSIEKKICMLNSD
jgi:hypothetical protein